MTRRDARELAYMMADGFLAHARPAAACDPVVRDAVAAGFMVAAEAVTDVEEQVGELWRRVDELRASRGRLGGFTVIPRQDPVWFRDLDVTNAHLALVFGDADTINDSELTALRARSRHERGSDG